MIFWSSNEKHLFKVIQAVHNRDNNYKLPKGLEIEINYNENSSKEKTYEDWMIEIENNIKTSLDWLSYHNPDLNQEELKRLLKSNKDVNSYKYDLRKDQELEDDNSDKEENNNLKDQNEL